MAQISMGDIFERIAGSLEFSTKIGKKFFTLVSLS
tara:strand:+ start:2471 stop:2575 length:105 start_codon:yes stop_codon:yes gene_type:complete